MNDPRTGLSYGPLNAPYTPGVPTPAELQSALDPMILSASGWRKVFAASGAEEDTTEEITKEDYHLAGAMALVYSRLLKKEGFSKPRIALGLDARPTGPAMASAMIKVFWSQGVFVEYLFIASAPEVMAYAKTQEHIHGFAYISASHNPIGHNGVKFGLSTGGVLGASHVLPLIEDYKGVLASPLEVEELHNILFRDWTGEMEETFQNSARYKEQSLKAYEEFSYTVLTQEKDPAQNKAYLNQIMEPLKKWSLGILGELNGSARGVTIDKPFLQSLGIKVDILNGQPRQVVHRIVPEGRSLDLCREELEKRHAQDPDFLLGYVPDNDGDRGNIVAIDPSTGKAEILEAQEVFALSCLSVLAEGEYKKQRGFSASDKVAVVVNGPTSMRIEEICLAFGVETHRAEVGEANVVGKAGVLQSQGYSVPILGEGSNGGNITTPAAVRDPLNTLGALIKLLRLTRDEKGPGLFEIWCQKSGQTSHYKKDFTLRDIKASLPQWITTSAYEDKAILRISSLDHARLKARYEDIFLTKWEKDKGWFEKKWGISAWEEINYEGGQVKRGFGPDFRSGAQKGGFKILLKGSSGQSKGYLWMRGSGTEPVFRVLVDVQGSDPRAEEELLAWHTSIIAEADQ